MKKILFVLTACLALFFTSCENKNNPEKMIVGDWKCHGVTSYYWMNGHLLSEETGDWNNVYISMYADHTMTFTDTGEMFQGRWILNGSTLLLNFSGGENMIFIVQKLTNAEMVLRMEFGEEYADYNFVKR